jgi:hypothetical protein
VPVPAGAGARARYRLWFASETEFEAAVLRAFVWLKRRIEETRLDGLLAHAGTQESNDLLSRVLGEAVTAIVREEGALCVDYDRSMRFVRFKDVPGDFRGPVALLAPGRAQVERALELRGLVLFVLADDVEIEGAGAPPPEDYTRSARHQEPAPAGGAPR